LLDDNLYPEDPTKSAVASLGAGTVGMLASQGLVQRALAKPVSTPPLKLQAMRFGAVYTVALSCVLVWRGAWLGWDIAYEKLHKYCSKLDHRSSAWHAAKSSFLHHAVCERLLHEDAAVGAADPGHATRSGLLSHAAAVIVMLAIGRFASVLAPPAAVSLVRDVAVHGGRERAAAAAATCVGTTAARASTRSSWPHRKPSAPLPRGDFSGASLSRGMSSRSKV
jgi:hypothetical protein